MLSGGLKLSGVVTWLLQMQTEFIATGADVVLLVTSKKTDIHPAQGRVFYTGRARTALLLRISRWLQLNRVFPHWYARKEEMEMNWRVERILTAIGWLDRVDLVVMAFDNRLPQCLRKGPVAETIHSVLSHNMAGFEKKTAQEITCHQHFIVPVSRVVAEDARNLGLSVAEVIYNPLNVDELRKASELFVPQIQRPYIVFVGRLKNEKGVHELLRAFAVLKADVDLVYVGAGSEINNLQNAACSLGVQDRVHFTGFMHNPYPWIRHARLLVLPSVSEAMGYAPVEAFALGCGIVVTDFPAAYEFFVDDVIVSRLPAEDYIERLAQKITAGLAGELPPGVKPGIVEKMAPQYVAEQYLALLNQAVV
ncbi:glycosyl transferase [Betaproteobacteria bacterium]|nr:glycosyl transferase [Betaproteobacteria bacterium]GHT99108.1 glycosyl transferase [Betaproteobacteria bacterium]GHU23018.1 glycosyl transferase [Betaproteobacteria bacterium]GHU28748.1 glycosyl transferase [Betaproteobacteria bacterium]